MTLRLQDPQGNILLVSETPNPAPFKTSFYGYGDQVPSQFLTPDQPQLRAKVVKTPNGEVVASGLFGRDAFKMARSIIAQATHPA